MNFFEILGVEVNSSDKEIKQAYRKKAKSIHPDKNSSTDSHSQFYKLQEAYQCLKEEESRKQYFELQQAAAQKKRQEQSASERIQKLREELLKREKLAKTPKSEPLVKRERTEKTAKLLEIRWLSGCSYTQNMLSHIFQEFGPIKDICVFEEYAILSFENYTDAEKCISRPPREFIVKETKEVTNKHSNGKSGIDSRDSLIKHRMKLLQTLRGNK